KEIPTMRQHQFFAPRYVVAFILFWSLFASTSITSAEICQNFPDTGFQVCGKFLTYWYSHGGLYQQGYPISGEFNEQNVLPPAGDGKVYRVQYFQRARFEEHLENAAPYDILLGLVGTEQFNTRYPTEN